MEWKWTFIEADTTTTVVDEPVGWDGVSFSLNRDVINHGIFSTVDTGSFQWVDSAFAMLLTEYTTNGANGQMELLIEYKCEGETTYTEYFRGAFDFNTFERICDDFCYIKCTITAAKCTDIFMSRMGQDVDVEATTNFDNDAITPMTFRQLNIEGQDILLQNQAYNTSGSVFNISGSYPTTGQKIFYIPVYLPNNPLTEYGDFNINNVTQFIVETPAFDSVLPPTDLADWLAYGSNLVNWARTDDPLNCIDNDAVISWRSKGGYEINTNFNGSVTVTLVMSKYDENTNTLAVISSNPTGGGSMTVTSGVPIIETFDITFVPTTPAYEEAQYLLYYWAVIFQVNTGSPSNFTFDLSYDAGNDNNYYTMSLNSECDPTICTSVYLPELLEFLSTAYMPSGCPSLEVESSLKACLDFYQITKGSFIRNVVEPSAPKLFVNFEYLIDQCRKIFNIGWGFDNNETELKVASIDYFYNSNVVVDVGLVDKATFTTAKDLIYGTITVGYNKWEAEEYNGLDETNTQRQYRRNIDSNPTELDLMSDLIAAGYTIEITRRKSQAKTGTSDWRYDDDLFIINAIVEDDILYAYRGTTDPANLYSPSTRMNLRLTPLRNLMRWFKSIAAPTPTITNEALKFTSGTGNYIAESRFADQCFIETGLVTENQTVVSTDVVAPTPIWQAIYATFSAPLTMAQFELIKADVYGAIRFRCFSDTYLGNIVEMSHDPNVGLAEFKLLIRK
jgi:hypothetical protein